MVIFTSARPATTGASATPYAARQKKATVALVVAHFDSHSNYLEVVLSKAMTEFADTHVIASTLGTKGLPNPDTGQTSTRYPEGASVWDGVHIHRLGDRFAVRNRVVSKGLPQLLDSLQPDLVVQNEPNQLFSLPVARWCDRNDVPYVYISGENNAQRPRSGAARLLARAYEATLRRWVYRHCVPRAECAFGTTPETTANLVSATGRQDIELLNLPVDTSQFSFDGNVRAVQRRAQGWEKRSITLFAGKFEERKDLLGLIDWWVNGIGRSPTHRLILVGYAPGKYADRVREHARSVGDGRVELRAFCSTDELARLYQAADLAVFPNATNGIQQAMATGLAVLIPRSIEVSHLFDLDGAYVLGFPTTGLAGWPDGETQLAEVLASAGDHTARSERASVARGGSARDLAGRLVTLCERA